MDIEIKTTNDILCNNAGLVFIGNQLQNKAFEREIKKLSALKNSSGLITDIDIIKSLIGLITLGKTEYDAIEEYRNDDYFKTALGLKRVASSPTLRQRINRLGTMPELHSIIKEFNKMLLKPMMYNESININGNDYMQLDIDVTPMDNSGSKKENVSKTYKLYDGYAPIMSYFGTSGFLLNTQLRPGKAHSNCEGTLEFLNETVDMALEITDKLVLVTLDSGNDALENILLLEDKARTNYIVKHNLRKENKEDWLEYARNNYEKQETIYEGYTKYYTTFYKELEPNSISQEKRFLKISLCVSEAIMDKKGQYLVIPEIAVDSYWTNLDFSAEDVEKCYHLHGTSEQYHSEFKTDLDMERLPSGKYNSNSLIMMLGMIAFNLLRILGKLSLYSGKVPGKRGKRLRIRTVILNIMYLAGKYIKLGRRAVLHIFTGNRWTPSYLYVSQ